MSDMAAGLPSTAIADAVRHEEPGTGALLILPGAQLAWYPQFLSTQDSAMLFAVLMRETCWTRHRVRIFGKWLYQPRLTAWHGDAHATYAYSGLVLAPRPWTPTLLAIRKRVQECAGADFNSVLVNLYRDGADSMGWHQDNEKELGSLPVIASLSLGASRDFQLRRVKPGNTAPVTISLSSGSLLLMQGDTQRHYRHRIAGTRRRCGARINLTFRRIFRDSDMTSRAAGQAPDSHEATDG